MSHRPEASTVVFLPGFMQRGEAWSGVVARVAERYPSAALDLGTCTLEGRLSEIARAAPPGAALVGYSMGGRLALHAVLRSPGRYAALAVVGAAAGIEDERERRARRAADESVAAWMEDRPIEEVVAWWETLPIFSTQDEELVARQRQGRLAHEPACLARLLRSAGQGAIRPVWDRVARIDAPVLALAGALDAPYAAAAERFAQLAPKGRARLVAGAGHAAHLEAPDTVARLLLEFLDEHLGEGRAAHLHA